MMIDPESLKESLRHANLTEIIKERDRIIREIRKYEKGKIPEEELDKIKNDNEINTELKGTKVLKKIDKIIDIEVDDEIIYKRMTGRRVCDNCGRSYNIDLEDAKPKIDGKCDSCSGTLVQRMDDKLETVKQRLKVYHDQTYVLKSYYENQNKLFVVDGVRPLDEINKDINKILEA